MFLGERIRQAREIRGLTQEELAEKLICSQALVAQVEAGFKLPTGDFIESVAEATEFPITFFNEPPHPEFGIAEILLRAQRTAKRREILGTVRYAEHVYAIYVALAARLKPIPVRIPEVVDSPKEAAKQVRKVLGLEPNSPIANLTHALERAGVRFIVVSPSHAHDAFCVWFRKDENETPLIAAVGGREDGDRYRLSVAHELGHLVMHRSFLRKSNKEVEDEAWAFAAELLMPEAAIRSELILPLTITALARLKPRWGVSVAALIRRAYDLNIVTKRQYHYLSHQMSALGYKTREPKNLDVPMEKPRLLRKMAEMVYGKPIDFDRFSADTKTLARELRMILKDYQEVGDDASVPALEKKVIRFQPRAMRN